MRRTPLRAVGPPTTLVHLTEAASSPWWRRAQTPMLLMGAVLLLAGALQLRDPHQSGSWGFCPWLVATGTPCPLCGGLRAVNDLGRGDLAAAASSNLLVLGTLPVFAAWWAAEMGVRLRGLTPRLTARGRAVASWVLIGVLVGFWVLRNLPFAAWLLP